MVNPAGAGATAAPAGSRPLNTFTAATASADSQLPARPESLASQGGHEQGSKATTAPAQESKDSAVPLSPGLLRTVHSRESPVHRPAGMDGARASANAGQIAAPVDLRPLEARAAHLELHFIVENFGPAGASPAGGIGGRHHPFDERGDQCRPAAMAASRWARSRRLGWG
jgi:hypothetical protein